MGSDCEKCLLSMPPKIRYIYFVIVLGWVGAGRVVGHMDKALLTKGNIFRDHSLKSVGDFLLRKTCTTQKVKDLKYP